MRRKTTILFLFAAIALTTSCASAGNQRTSGSPDKLDKAQIEATNTTSAYDVVSRLRPNWLRPAGMSMGGLQNSGQQQPPLVYMDDHRLGEIAVLRNITTASVMSMEYLSPTKAATQLNDMTSGAISAVIMIRTK